MYNLGIQRPKSFQISRMMDEWLEVPHDYTELTNAMTSRSRRICLGDRKLCATKAAVDGDLWYLGYSLKCESSSPIYMIELLSDSS